MPRPPGQSGRGGTDCVGAGRSRWKRRFSGTTAIPFHAFATIFAECADLWHIRSYQYSYCVTRRRLSIVFFVRFIFIESVVHSSPERCIRSARRLRRVLLDCGTRAFVWGLTKGSGAGVSGFILHQWNLRCIHCVGSIASIMHTIHKMALGRAQTASLIGGGGGGGNGEGGGGGGGGGYWGIAHGPSGGDQATSAP